jgi:hypothetical protein
MFDVWTVSFLFFPTMCIVSSTLEVGDDVWLGDKGFGFCD